MSGEAKAFFWPEPGESEWSWTCACGEENDLDHGPATELDVNDAVLKLLNGVRCRKCGRVFVPETWEIVLKEAGA